LPVFFTVFLAGFEGFLLAVTGWRALSAICGIEKGEGRIKRLCR
jgi:hypothetical protein